MDNTSELIKYIVQQLKQGVPEQTIRATLLQNGWPAEPIERAFVMLRQNGLETPMAVNLPDVTPGQPMAPFIEQPNIPNKPAMPPKNNSKFVRRLIIGIIVLGIMALAIPILLTLTDKPAPEQQKKADADTIRKTHIQTLKDRFSSYYKVNEGTYPSLAQLNDIGFSSSKGGFSTTGLRDPEWEPSTAACIDEQGKHTFAASRSVGCYSYRATALTGDDCDGKNVKCTRIVLTATLEGDQPFIAVLDQNKEEK